MSVYGYEYDNQPLSDDNIDLAKFEDSFMRTKPKEKKYQSVPDGKYAVLVENVALTRSKTTGNPLLKWALNVLDGPYQGRRMWHNNVIATDNNVQWLRNDLYTSGLEIKSLAELKDQLHKLRNIRLEVTKRTQGQYENIYFNRLLQGSENNYNDSASKARGQF